MTYSIVARDPTTSELGIAVQSRYFAAGREVPWIEAGVGAIALQSFASPVYGHEGLGLLRSGLAPQPIRASLQRAHRIHPGGSKLLLCFADAGVIPVPRAMLEPLVAGLGIGTPTYAG
jgi:hypothetical protein